MIIRFALLFACICLAGAAEPDLSAGPPPKASPSTPGWGYWAKSPKDWIRTHEGQRAQARKDGAEVVFIGDSITQGWRGAGKELWAAHYAPLKAANCGIGGDSTRQVLWRIEQGLLDGLAAKLVVVAIGTNNLYGDHNGGSDAEIAAGVKTAVAAVRARQPAAKVLVLGMLPRENAYFCGRIAAINAISAKLDDGKDVRFLDPGAAFLEAPGTVKAELYSPDKVHLTTAGYQALDAAIRPLVIELAK